MVSWVISHACSYCTKTAQAATFLNRSLEQFHCPYGLLWQLCFTCSWMHGLEACVLTLEDVKLLYIGPLLSVTFLSLQEHTMTYVLGKVFVLFIFFYSPGHRAETGEAFIKCWMSVLVIVNKSKPIDLFPHQSRSRFKKHGFSSYVWKILTERTESLRISTSSLSVYGRTQRARNNYSIMRWTALLDLGEVCDNWAGRRETPELFGALKGLRIIPWEWFWRSTIL